MRKSLKEKGQFYTSEELAKTLKSYLPDDDTPVFDPACGHGSLLAVFPDKVEKFGCDIEKEAENIDHITIEKQARLAMWRKIEADMNMSKIICELDGWDFEKYREFLLERIKKF